jgi:hypothetical protein
VWDTLYDPEVLKRCCIPGCQLTLTFLLARREEVQGLLEVLLARDEYMIRRGQAASQPRLRVSQRRERERIFSCDAKLGRNRRGTAADSSRHVSQRHAK